MRRPSLEDAVPALVGAVVTATVGVAMWCSEAPWTFTLDTGSVFVGQTVPAFREWFAGRVPEWSDLLWGGFPLIGDCTTAALYPLYALILLATNDSPLRFFDVAFALHLGIFAAGSAALVRRLGASPRAVVFAGMLAALTPAGHFSAIAHFPVFGAQAWWPWAFFAVETLARPTTPLFGSAMVLGWVSLAMQVLVGVPEQATYCAVPATIWLLVRRSPLGLGQRLARVAVLGLGATALAAPQLLPTMLLLPWTHRAEIPPHYQFGSTWLVHPVQLFVAGTGVLNGIPNFLGLATMLLAVIAVLARRPGAAFILTMGGVAFALALGPQVGLYEWLHRLPPFDRFRNPGKLYCLAEYSVLWLAALGADALGRRRSAAAHVLAVLLVVGTLLERAVYLPQEIAAIAKLRRGDQLTPERYARLAELGRLRRPDPTAPPPVVYDFGGLLDGEYARSIGALLGISSIHAGVVALLSPAHFELLTQPSAGMLDLFGVRYALGPSQKCTAMATRLGWPIVETSSEDCVLANPEASKRHLLLDDVVRTASMREMVDAVRRQPRPVPIVAPSPVSTDRARGGIALSSYISGRATLLSVTYAPALVLVRDSFAPGWVARVDGRRVTPYPAAGIFFAVPVDAGVHMIELEYRAPGLREGALIAVGWTGIAIAASHLARRRRRHAGTS